MHRLLVALLLVPGCAFGIKAPDPDRPRSQPPVCDSGKGAVAIDGLMAGVAGIVAVSIVEDAPGAALIPLGIGALYLGGALKGNSNANKCREARADFESYVAARETLDMPRRRPSLEDPDATPLTSMPARPMPTASVPAPALVVPVPPAPTPQPVASVPVPAGPAPAPAPRAPAKPQPQPKPEPDDDWSAFWREVE
jgi:hypothetical protein